MNGIILAHDPPIDGIIPELLPIDSYKSSLDTHLVSLTVAGAEHIFIIAHKDKLGAFGERLLSKRIQDMGIQAHLTLTEDISALCSDTRTCIGYADTVVPPEAYSLLAGDEDLIIGTFRTNKTQAHTVFMGQSIVVGLDPFTVLRYLPLDAIGIISAQKHIIHTIMQTATLSTIYENLNPVLRVYDFSRIILPYFYTIKTSEQYIDYLRSIR